MSWFSKASGGATQAAQGYMTQDKQAQMGVQALKVGSQAVPGGQQFQFFPVQVGGATPYAKSRKPHFVVICVYQVIMAVMALIEFANFLSGIIMILGCLVALWAFKEDMNITYICWWGMLCVAGFIAGMVGALIGFAVMLSTIVLKFNIPLSCLFGMALAWNLYSDYEENKHCNDHVGSWLRALGLLKEAPPPTPPSSANALGGWLPQFGNSGTDAMNKGVGSYGSIPDMSAYQQQMSGYEKRMEDQGSQLFGGAQGQANRVLGRTAEAAQLPGGKHNTRMDPFMTL